MIKVQMQIPSARTTLSILGGQKTQRVHKQMTRKKTESVFAFHLLCTCCWCSRSWFLIQFVFGFNERIPCRLLQKNLDKLLKQLVVTRLAWKVVSCLYTCITKLSSSDFSSCMRYKFSNIVSAGFSCMDDTTSSHCVSNKSQHVVVLELHLH